MQQRQLRLGDTLDDYCPRERRLTNHVIVALVGDDVKQVRCATCDCDHEYKHAKVPRQRKKGDTPAALYAQVAAQAPVRVAHEPDHQGAHADESDAPQDAMADPAPEPMPDASIAAAPDHEPEHEESAFDEDANASDEESERDLDQGPAHRRLIRASLPRPEGQQPPARPIPEFTIRQPGGRPNRFRPRHGHSSGGQPPRFGNRSNGNFGGPSRGGSGSGGHHQRHGRKRSK